MAQRTFDVEHPETHYPTEAAMRAALRELLKEDGEKFVGDPEFAHVVTTSGGPSKVRATFESEPATVAKPESKTTTKTVGGKAS